MLSQADQLVDDYLQQSRESSQEAIADHVMASLMATRSYVPPKLTCEQEEPSNDYASFYQQQLHAIVNAQKTSAPPTQSDLPVTNPAAPPETQDEPMH